MGTLIVSIPVFGKKEMKKPFSLFALLAVLPCAATAQMHKASDTDTAKIRRTVNLGPVVVTGGGHHQHARSSATPVHVITSDEIQATGITTFQEAMTRMMPQMSAAPNSMGSFLRMNGLGNKYVLILVNGHKLTGDIGGNVDLNRINLDRVKRIEVLDGAASALYGSDAIGGVINIITDQTAKELINITTNTRVSGEGQFTQSANLDIRHKNFGSYTSFTHDEADSWRNSDYEYVSGDEGETQFTVAPFFVGYASNIVSQRFDYSPLRNLALHAELGYTWKKTDRPETSSGVAGGFAYELRSEGWRWNVGGVYKLSRRNSILFDFTSDDYEYGHQYDTDSEAHPRGSYSLTKAQTLYNAEVKGIFGLTANSTTIVGVDWRNEFMNSVTGNVDRHNYTISGYAQHEMNFWRDFSAVVSLRYNYNGAFGSDITPKVALMYAPGNFNFRATYSNGYRSPGLDELYYHYYTFTRGRSTITLGNDRLAPEQSNYFSINAEYNTPRFSIGVTGYLNYVSDMIVKKVIATDDARMQYLRSTFPEITDEQAAKITRYSLYQNSDRGRVAGMQVNMSAKPADGLTVSVNYSYTLARYESDGEWQNLERSIRNTVVVTAAYSRTWRKYTLALNVNGRMQSKTYYPSYSDAPGHGIWNFNTTHNFHVNRCLEIQPSIGVDNIFNKRDMRIDGDLTRYANFSPGRMVVAGVKIRL